MKKFIYEDFQKYYGGVKMEIHLVEKKKNKRYKNIEILKEKEFFDILEKLYKKSLPWFMPKKVRFEKLKTALQGYFKHRLELNLNKKKR